MRGKADLTPNLSLTKTLREKRKRGLVMFLPWGCCAVSAVAIVQADKGEQRMERIGMELTVTGRGAEMERGSAAKRMCGD
jgi:hypothetical protein